MMDLTSLTALMFHVKHPMCHVVAAQDVGSSQAETEVLTAIRLNVLMNPSDLS